MPNLIELSGLLNGGGFGSDGFDDADFMAKLGLLGRGRARRVRAAKAATAKPTSKAASKKKVRGPSAEKALEISKALLAKGNKALAMAWAKQAFNKAKVEGRSDIAKAAEDLMKQIRGAAALQAFSPLGDIDALVMGRIMGLW